MGMDTDDDDDDDDTNIEHKIKQQIKIITSQ